TGGFGEQSKSLDNLLKNFAGMGAETWMGKLSAPTTMQARNTLLGLMRKELGVIVARGHARLILARARSLHGHAKVIIASARLERTGTGTGNGGGTRTDCDDDGNPDEWAEGAYHLRRKTQFGIGA
ncbi:hypothetical protein T492DRAFT_873052, partial [Pavlovales sp. CCMP2436]